MSQLKTVLMASALIAGGTILLMSEAPRSASGAMVTATWYGPGFSGKKTASGDTFDPNALTAAHPSLPFGTMLLVCDDRCAQVEINDRTGATNAELDLSEGAARATGLIDEGKGQVSVVNSPTPSSKAPDIVELPATGGPYRDAG